ncbi:ATP-binding protein [Nocardiopsis mangrovi]|uniref:ATP-binding protein n=1 Tax=Nocardiopsis mangrovi TaxID=1179818 RepID=A0ABV9DSF4_9ACTN
MTTRMNRPADTGRPPLPRRSSGPGDSARACSFIAAFSSVGPARRFARANCGFASGSQPCDVEVCVSELATNSVRHSRSSRPGGRFTVAVATAPGWCRVQVADDGPLHPRHGPRLHPPDAFTESGRGLHLLDALSSWWGVDRDLASTTVWFEITR